MNLEKAVILAFVGIVLVAITPTWLDAYENWDKPEVRKPVILWYVGLVIFGLWAAAASVKKGN